MLPCTEKPRVTEIKVRMDCNGCVQKIKKALNGITGIYEIYIDFPKQKLTVVGWADEDKIMKAIKKTRKIATICTHPESKETAGSEPPPAPPADGPPNPPPQDAGNPPTAAPPADGPPNPPPPDAGNPPPPAENPPPPAENPPPPAENPPSAEAANPPTAESAQHQPPPPPPENPAPEVAPSAVAADAAANLPPSSTEAKDVEVIQIDHRTHNYRYTSGRGFQHEPPHYVSYSYKPSVYTPEHGYVTSPSRNSQYTRVEHYGDDDRNRVDGNENISSMFSDENPNACSMM